MFHREAGYWITRDNAPEKQHCLGRGVELVVAIPPSTVLSSNPMNASLSPVENVPLEGPEREKKSPRSLLMWKFIERKKVKC